MSKDVNPKKIYENYLNNIIDEASTIEKLRTLIENSNDINIRINSVEYLNEIGNLNNDSVIKDITLFSLFENLLISDSNEKIRYIAATILKSKFLENSFDPMIWALHHDPSPKCLEIIFTSLVKIVDKLLKTNDNISKINLLNKVKKINEKEFKIGFEQLCENKRDTELRIEELADILINYFCFIYLKKTIWRLKYVVKHCKIVELDFIFKGLTKLPEPIKYLGSLQKLILRYNQFTILPDWIVFLNSLEILNLNINNITELPNNIGSLKSLREILLWKNYITILPDSICSLNSLEKLNLRLNQLVKLPSCFGNLFNLRELNLHDNKLNSLPESIGTLSSLETLNLSWNELESIPNSIGSLKSLTFLDLERNELSSIPPSIGKLFSLKILNLSDNNLTEIPQTIGNLKNLQILNLSKNNISELPPTIKMLPSLKEIYIGENNFILDPKDFNDLKRNCLKIFK